jgi:hypothetical protein
VKAEARGGYERSGNTGSTVPDLDKSDRLEQVDIITAVDNTNLLKRSTLLQLKIMESL